MFIWYDVLVIVFNISMAKIMLQGYECERCGHKWVKRSATEGDPVICPKCKSPYWDKPRRSVAA